MPSKFNTDLLGSITGLEQRVSEAVAEPKAEPVKAEKKPKTENGSKKAPTQTAKETKTKCFQLRLKPSQYEALEKQAEAEGRSVNNLIERLLDEGLNKK